MEWSRKKDGAAAPSWCNGLGWPTNASDSKAAGGMTVERCQAVRPGFTEKNHGQKVDS